MVSVVVEEAVEVVVVTDDVVAMELAGVEVAELAEVDVVLGVVAVIAMVSPQSSLIN